MELGLWFGLRECGGLPRRTSRGSAGGSHLRKISEGWRPLVLGGDAEQLVAYML